MSRFTAVLDAHRYKGEFFFPSSDGMKAGIWSQCFCGHRGAHAAHVESMLVEAGVVAVELPEAEGVAKAIFAYHAQGQDFSPNLDDHEPHTQEYWLGQALVTLAAAVRPVTPEEPRLTDPAHEAAQRAWTERYGADQLARFHEDCAEDENVAAFVVAAAREALAPLKELHRPHSRPESYYNRSPVITVCNHCLGPKTWPCPTALWLYSDAELNPEGTTP